MDNQLSETTVAQQENNGFGPLSKPRGRAATYASVVVVIVSAVLLVFSVKEKDTIHGIPFLVFSAAFLTLSVIFGELVRRMCLVMEEIQHKKARYQGNLKHAFKTTFAFKYGRCILVVTVACALIVCYSLYERNEVWDPNFAIFFSLNCFLVPQLLFLVGLRELSPVETSEINERENKNVADGLAWSYFSGYLKLVLPKLEFKISESAEFRKKITIKKLFILLPKNCAAGSEIKESDPRVTVADALSPLEINRAGIKKRSYKHTVHKIVIPRPDGREIDEENVYHCVVEYATPLLSLYEMSGHPEAGFSRQERDHQVNCPVGEGR